MSDAVSRLNAALEGRYTIERELGEGGMATVYLAEDLKHERKVALKVLKPVLAAVVGAERFLAEIKTTANLQHPHILALYDSGQADGYLYYVMPYIDGETLRDRLEREKQLPIDEAVRIATDVADALHAAHEQGVIHRDIKPANILLSRGRPLVADFGIALAIGAAGGSRLTETGLSVGTPFYMSPEQVTGDHAIGPSTDTYALSCVLYEMLVGDPPHAESSAQAVITKIIAGEPVSPASKRPTVPPNVDAAVRRALELLPADRFSGVEDFARALADPSFRHRVTVAGDSTSAPAFGKVMAASGWAVALVALLVMGWGLGRSEPRQVVRSEIYTTGEQEWLAAGGIGITISPDGSAIAYVGQTDVWYRRLDQLESRKLNGTQLARMPVISPDGATIAFVARGSLMTTSSQGGPATVVVPSGVRDGGGGIAWGSDDTLYFVDMSGVVQRVPASGGPPVEVAVPEPGTSYTWLEALPEDKGLLLTITAGTTELSRIAVFDFASGSVRALFPGTTARYASSGHLVYASADSSLAAVPFDLTRLDVGPGEPMDLIDRLDVNPGSASQFSLSRMGTLVYVTGGTLGASTVMEVDRSGNASEVDAEWSLVGTSDIVSLALSPDGDRLAVNRLQGGTVSIWVKPLSGEPPERVTFGAGAANERRASWSPDGQSLAFLGDSLGQYDIWRTRADGIGGPELLLDPDDPVNDVLFSPDYQWLIYETGRGLQTDLYAARIGTDDDPVELAVSDFGESGPVISPDGRWLAYTSNVSGRDEVYVVRFPDPLAARRTPVSGAGGTEAVWAHNGRELFYRSADNQLVAAQYEADESFVVTERLELFSIEGYVRGFGRAQYAVSPDDESFFMLRSIAPESITRIILVQNFFEELEGRARN